MYDGAKFSYDGDFLGYLGLEGMGIFTNHDKERDEQNKRLWHHLYKVAIRENKEHIK
ncbi:hypothetical protein [Lachnobacterium bovis]|uniref:hypothetical protein n=1 Tax=Lachnobacterium bovis TaxID=140626 RepID=UPI000A5A3F66|nr:hypothetical protein [Lachnobacterium bovis]